STVRGSATRRWESKPAPKPEGRKTSVWVSVWRQLPGTRGESVGCSEPSASATGFEKVSVIGVAGATCAPGAGLLTATGSGAGGTQLAATGAPRRSRGRAAAATSTEPAAARRPSDTDA